MRSYFKKTQRYRQMIARHAYRRFVRRCKIRRYMKRRRRMTIEEFIRNKPYRDEARQIHSFKDTLQHFLPVNLSHIMNCDQGVFSFDKLGKLGRVNNGIVSIPKNFSIIDNPKESYEVIQRVMSIFLSQKSKSLRLDYSKCESIDLVTMVFLDAILKDIDKYWKSCGRANVDHYCKLKEMGGYNYENPVIFKMINSVGSPDIIINRHSTYSDVIPFRLRCFDSLKATKGKRLMQKEIDTTQVLEYINNCLGRYHKTLSPEASREMGFVVAETLINAEEHSSTGYRYLIGYMEEYKDSAHKHSGVFNLVIMNFGQTIYEKFKNVDSRTEINQECLNQMKELSELYKKRSLFKESFNEETLWTLYSLQQGVTCVPHQKRGNGTIQFINSFLKLRDNDDNDTISHMYILSGNTIIEFDGKYQLFNKIDSNGKTLDIISFNESGSLREKPDSRYVRHVREYFPGTAIYVRLLLNDDDIINS